MKRKKNVCNYAEAVWDEAIEVGMKQGMESGMAKGMAKGMESGILMSLKNLLLNSRQTSPDEAMVLLGIAEDDRPMYRARLNI